ncbi:MAG: hypothetical protein AAF744_16480 [Pseudomonadota bacterium]
MTSFEIAVPLLALIVAGVGTLLIRRSAHQLERARSKRPPAE